MKHTLRPYEPVSNTTELLGKASKGEAVAEVKRMGQRDLQEMFKKVYGSATKSNNNCWLRRKLLQAAQDTAQATAAPSEATEGALVNKRNRQPRKRGFSTQALGPRAHSDSPASTDTFQLDSSNSWPNDSAPSTSMGHAFSAPVSANDLLIDYTDPRHIGHKPPSDPQVDLADPFESNLDRMYGPSKFSKSAPAGSALEAAYAADWSGRHPAGNAHQQSISEQLQRELLKRSKFQLAQGIMPDLSAAGCLSTQLKIWEHLEQQVQQEQMRLARVCW